MKGPNFEVKKAYEDVHSNPDFAVDKKREEKTVITPLDTFAIPAELIQDKENFLAWFEPRFFKLTDENGNENEEGLLNFSKDMRDAVAFLKDHPYILSPRINEGFNLLKSVEKIVANGFSSVEEIRSFLKKVALPNTPKNIPKFFSPDRISGSGAEKITTCRTVSVAYIIERVRKSNDFRDFIKYARFVLGRDTDKGQESGILSKLLTDGRINILSEDEEKFSKIYDWMEKEQKIKDCHLNNIGPEGVAHSYHIPELHIGIKDGGRTFFKYLRDPKKAFDVIDDFFRFRFIFDDNTPTEKILELMHDLQEEAKRKKEPRVEIEFREKNYLTEEEKGEYFSEKNGKNLGGFLDNIKIDKNPSGGKGFKNMSAKIKLFRGKEKKYFFSFEIMFLRKKEHAENENLERESNHFLMEMRQSSDLSSRMTGKMTAKEMVEALKNYMEKNIKTEEIPRILLGRSAKKTGDEDKEEKKLADKNYIEQDFTGSLQEKAQKLFDFLVADGTIKAVSSNFPEEKRILSLKEKTHQFLGALLNQINIKAYGNKFLDSPEKEKLLLDIEKYLNEKGRKGSPELLLGFSEKKKQMLEVNFIGDSAERAKIIFNFLVDIGKIKERHFTLIKKVSPSKEVSSKYYLSKQSLNRLYYTFK